ncbi:hypothetical protein D7W81_22430 [Corallococcus aberystwythensis]|uniref:Uncharacterized protein n=1 Tax=Corallococcus aberystwythensis TaxID=2316722 RepID=A0A3A8Q123_9BACT|nr:hypothetical protein D7W81_22430 [Corallococcus aberystwythensis]
MTREPDEGAVRNRMLSETAEPRIQLEGFPKRHGQLLGYVRMPVHRPQIKRDGRLHATSRANREAESLQPLRLALSQRELRLGQLQVAIAQADSFAEQDAPVGTFPPGPSKCL